MSGVGRDPEHHPNQTPWSGQGQFKHVAMGQVLNISKDGYCIPSLGRPVQCSTSAQSQQQKSLLFGLNMIFFLSVAQLPLVLQ